MVPAWYFRPGARKPAFCPPRTSLGPIVPNGTITKGPDSQGQLEVEVYTGASTSTTSDRQCPSLGLPAALHHHWPAWPRRMPASYQARGESGQTSALSVLESGRTTRIPSPGGGRVSSLLLGEGRGGCPCHGLHPTGYT